MNKKDVIKSLIIVTISMMFFVVSIITAFLVFKEEVPGEVVVGLVDVDIDQYFMKDNERYEVTPYSTFGVVTLNISDSDSINFFDNFRVDILINSTVDTYFRLNVYEMFTLTSDETETGITRDEYSKFGFGLDFFDNREFDDHFYYKNKVERTSESVPLRIPLITKNDNYTHPIYDPKYSIKIGVQVDAVQALLGPLNNWGLENNPWNNEAW